MGDNMANNRQNRRKMHQKIDTMSTSFSGEIGKVIKVLIAVVIFLTVFYFLTVYLLNNDTDDADIDTTPGEADIQYQEILAGSSFNISDDKYLVLYYDMSDENLKSDYTNMISTYEGKEEHFPIYTVDMSSTFNKDYVADSSNKDVDSLENLKISKATLLEFENGEVINYIEGKDDIKQFLE